MQCKSYSHFSAKKVRILYIESTKTVNEMTLNELVKLTTLWTTGPWITFAPDAVRFICLRLSVRFFRHRKWLRATAYSFTFYTSTVQFLVRAFGVGSRQSRTETVRRSYGNRAVSAFSALKSYSARAASIRRSRGDGTVTAQFPYDLRLSCSFWYSCTKSVQKSYFCLYCWMRWHLKQKAGRERDPRRKMLTHGKAATRSWCVRRGIVAR